MSQNPDYKYDPCYIEWKASQDAKLTEIWTRREQVEKTMADYERIQREHAARERENRQRSYLSSTKVDTKFVKIAKLLKLSQL